MILRPASWKLSNVFWMNDFNGPFAMYFWCHETQLSCGALDILKWFITVIFATTAILRWASGTLHHSTEGF